MRCFRSVTFGLLSMLLLVARATAQDPTVPPPPPPPVYVAAPPPSGGFWTSVCASCAAKKAALSHSPLCKLLKNALAPLSALTGGVVPGAVGPAAAELAAPGPVGAAAKIKADQIAAAKRREAVRFLGTIDCHWFPEAEAGLVAALRIDRSECVRFEAARALAHGCCCTKTTIEALSICVAGDERDGNPGENSLRVQLMAFEALQRCVSSYHGEAAEAPLPRPEHPATRVTAAATAPEGITGLPPIRFTAYYDKVRAASRDEVLANAKRVVQQASQRKVATQTAPRRATSVAEIWAKSDK
jgi:hypothetical protein